MSFYSNRHPVRLFTNSNATCLLTSSFALLLVLLLLLVLSILRQLLYRRQVRVSFLRLFVLIIVALRFSVKTRKVCRNRRERTIARWYDFSLWRPVRSIVFRPFYGGCNYWIPSSRGTLQSEEIQTNKHHQQQKPL